MAFLKNYLQKVRTNLQSFYFNYHFISSFLLVLVTGGRKNLSWKRNELSCNNKTEIIGSKAELPRHPRVWGHSMVLTNDYRILICGGINSKLENNDAIGPPKTWSEIQAHGLVS